MLNQNQNIINNMGCICKNQARLELQQYKVINQSDQFYSNLKQQYQTSHSICGYVTCGMANFISKKSKLNFEQITTQITQQSTLASIQDAMKYIQQKRLEYILKKTFNAKEQYMYLKDWVANYEIEDYLNQNINSFKNKNVIFFRNVAYDHPKQVANVKNEQLQRIQFQKQFKGQHFFLTLFPTRHVHLQDFQKQIVKMDLNQPIIIVVDCFGHFTTVVYYSRKIHILDSLKYSNFKLNESCRKIYRLFKQWIQGQSQQNQQLLNQNNQ